MKIARINPIYKKGSPDVSENYRPISILPIFSKITEKILNEQILKYLETNNLLSDSQFGFRKNRSTADALIAFTNQTLKAFNSKHCVLGIFIDFSKAFDTIDHGILLTKLQSIGFSTSSVNLLKNYVSNRKQVTKINQTISDINNITCEVPQGSVLGSTLFLIYINDLCYHLKHLTPILYADDTNLFIQSHNLNSKITSINEDLSTLYRWCIMNKLTINLTKTNYIILKNHQNKFCFNKNSIVLNNIPITNSNSIKFLGILLDNHLNWTSHVTNILTDLRPIAGLFYRISSFLPTNILLLLYNSFINSKLTYCLESWGSMPQYSTTKIHIFQKKLLRIINKKPFDFPSADLFRKNRILNINQLYKQKILLQAHSSFHNTSHTRHTYHTRHVSSNLSIPLFKTSAGQRSTTYQESALWNNLPNNLKSIQSKIMFKKELKHFLLG